MNLFSILLLQADTAVQAVQTAPAAPEKISLWYLLREGGLLMIPLLLCSIALVYVFAERWLVVRKAARPADPHFMSRIREHIAGDNLQAARSLSRQTEGPVARVIEKGVSRIGKPVDQIEKSMENTGKLEVYQLEKNLGVLSTIAKIAPMFGFLGTIAGMIILFFNIQHSGKLELETVASGIYTKMVTSAVGLIIGLLAYVAYDYLNAQINKSVNRMEAASVDFLDILQERALK